MRGFPSPSVTVAAQLNIAAPGAAPAAATAPVFEPDVDGGDATDTEPNTSPPTLGGESRAEVLHKLAESGVDHSAWTRTAAAVVVDLKRELPRELGRKLQFGKLECFTKGCAWDVVYDNPEAYETSSEGFWHNSKLSSWGGVRARTKLETLESGKVVVSWLLLNPDLAGNQSAN